MQKDSCCSIPDYEYSVTKSRKIISIPSFSIQHVLIPDKIINDVHCCPEFNVFLFFTVRQKKYIGYSCDVTT